MVPGAIEQGSQGVATAPGEFVAIAFPDRRDVAERLLTVLERNDVPAMIDDGRHRDTVYAALGRGVGVLVPAHLHDAATEIIAKDDDEMEDDDLYDDDDDDFDDDDMDDLDDLDDDYDEDEDDDFDPEVDEDEDLE